MVPYIDSLQPTHGVFLHHILVMHDRKLSFFEGNKMDKCTGNGVRIKKPGARIDF